MQRLLDNVIRLFHIVYLSIYDYPIDEYNWFEVVTAINEVKLFCVVFGLFEVS